MELVWSQFNGDRFQRFANALVHYEVSKSADLFSMPGKDGGVDQLYTGDYGGKTGTWRFQDKFHLSSTPSKDVFALKSDILYDIKQNYKGEKNIIYISNVNLGVTKFKEIKTAANKVLKDLGAKCIIDIWHHAKLEAIVTKYPSLYYAYWGKDSILLQEYQEYFAVELKEKNDHHYFSLANKYYRNPKDFEVISKFINNPDQRTLAIISEGGYGKTRLCIQYFSDALGDSDKWFPLVLNEMGFNANELSRTLQTERQLLILIDDAHRNSKVAAETMRQIDSQGKHKLILTSRNTVFNELRSELTTFKRPMIEYQLLALPYEERKRMINEALPGIDSQAIAALADKSKGIPLIILDYIRAIKSGRQPDEVSVDKTFREWVLRVIKEAVTDVAKQALLSESACFDYLKILSLVSPISENTESEKSICDLLLISPDKLQLLTNTFATAGLLSRKNGLSMKPDAYSDVLIIDILSRNNAFIQKVKGLMWDDKYLANMIANLANIEVVEPSAEQFLQGEIRQYIEQLYQPVPLVSLIRIFSFAKKVVFRKPQIGIIVVEGFLLRINGTYIEDIQQNPSEYSVFKQISKYIVSILAILANNAGYHENVGHSRVLKLIMNYWLITKDNEVIGRCYRYSKYDIEKRAELVAEKQIFLTNKIIEIIKYSKKEEQKKFAVEVSKVLLSFDLQRSEYFEPQTMQFTFIAGDVPYVLPVKANRIKLKNAIAELFSNLDSKSPIYEDIMKLLLHGLFFAFKGSIRHKAPLDEEATMAIKFWTEYIQTKPDTIIKAAVWHTLIKFSRGGVLDQHELGVKELDRISTQSKSNKEALQTILLREEHFYLRNEFEKELIEIITIYNDFDKLFADFIDLRISDKTKQLPTGYYYHVLTDKYPEAAMILLNHIREHHRELMNEAFYLFRAKDDNKFIYFAVDELWKESAENNISLIWSILTIGRRNNSKLYQTDDLKYMQFILDKELSGMYWVFWRDIKDYISVDNKRSFELLDQLLNKENDNLHYDLLFYALTENQDFSTRYKNEIYALVKKHPNLFEPEDPTFETITQFIEQQFDYAEMMNFCEMVLVQQKGKYYFGSIGDVRRIRPQINLSTDKIIKDFATLVNKYVESSTEEEENIAFDLVRYFRPNEKITLEFQEMFDKIIQTNKDNELGLYRIANTVRLFEHYQEEFRLLADLCQYLYELDITFSDNSSIFGRNFLLNIGPKSKNGFGIAMSEDIKKEKLLTEIIAENRYYDGLVEYLKSALKRVQEDMAKDIQEDLDQIRD